jgi:hypothetical protein
LQPREHFFHDEAAKLTVASVVLLPGLQVQVVDKRESGRRQSLAVEERLENRKDLHLLQIEFAIEKKAEPVGLIGGAAQQMDGSGITEGRIRDGVFFEFKGALSFCHAQQFNHEGTQLHPMLALLTAASWHLP